MENKITKNKKVLIAYPKNFLPPQEAAVNAVTGGHPEEMNGMPPDTNPADEGVVFDGSDLASQRKR